jgi:glycopeptide antibiotics resistance protein
VYILGDADLSSPLPVILFPPSPFTSSPFLLLSHALKSPSPFTSRLIIATFVVYLAVVAALTVVPTHLARIRSADPNHINIIPFGYSFKCYRIALYQYPQQTISCLRNTFGNIAMFVPLGILLPLLAIRFQSLKRVLLLALGASLTIETIQFFLRFVGNPRAVDIDDVILNTLGACLGFAIYRTLMRLPVRDERTATSGGPSDANI